MANQEQVERLKRSVEEWNVWRQLHPEIRPDLSRAILSETNLDGVDLGGATLSRAILKYATLISATLTNADLSSTNLACVDLNRANLCNANLSSADLYSADLSCANLSSVDLRYANLTRADLTETDLTQARFSDTTFAWVNLSKVSGLETTIHHGPSIVDPKSVALPHDEHIRRQFLRNTGFSDIFIDYLPSLLTLPIQYYSLFLSYSHYDETFTRRLHNDLQNHGVRCWFAPHDLRPGTPIVRGIEEAIHLHEKLLLILSYHAVNSPWVQQEVEAALYKEVTTGQEMLFPIRLDNTILQSETLWAKRLRQRHIGDFTGWRDDDAYPEAFSTLLRHLKVAKPPTAS